MSKPKGIGDKYIELTFHEGKTTIQPHGFTGGSCRTETAGLEKALGTVSKRKVLGAACEQKVKA